MSTIEQKEFAVTKVLARAGVWYDTRKTAQECQRAGHEQRVRSVGRYEKAGNELADAVANLRKVEAHHG
jgi:hypothetical protein